MNFRCVGIMAAIDTSILQSLVPMASLSAGRLHELAQLSFVEKVSKDIDPFRLNVSQAAQSLYLLKGDLHLQFDDGSESILRGGLPATKYSVGAGPKKVKQATALTEIEILRVDSDLLDIMMTWDQLADIGKTDAVLPTKTQALSRADTTSFMNNTGIFSVDTLQKGVFSKLPAANVEEMFNRMTKVDVAAGQVIIHQGAEGDYYYLIKQGLAEVTRSDGAGTTKLAELTEGSAFGEEALVSDNKRNATVTMKTDGVLWRLNKSDFTELLKAPLLREISYEEAKEKIDGGAIWLDVRLPSEFSFNHLKGAQNLPLNIIRNSLDHLDPNAQFIIYCQTGRRSLAAAFILAQNGLQAFVLSGGIKSARSV